MSVIFTEKYDVPYNKTLVKRIPHFIDDGETVLEYPLTPGKAFVAVEKYDGLPGMYPEYFGIFLIDDNGCNVKSDYFPEVLKDLWSKYQKGELVPYSHVNTSLKTHEEQERD